MALDTYDCFQLAPVPIEPEHSCYAAHVNINLG